MTRSVLDEALTYLVAGDGPLRVQLENYIAIVNRWNPSLSLVASADLTRLEEHVADSLSLVPYLGSIDAQGVHLLDIGSGAGFPAIPLKLALPNITVTMFERSEKKATFLSTCARNLALSRVTILNEPFTAGRALAEVTHITCRAVEQPEALAPELIPYLERGSTLLCQSERLDAALPAGLRRQVITDEWTESGLRRGKLTLIHG